MNEKFKRFNAFTLAEVLITLGVIGVVAAVTMPTLIKNYQKHVVVTKLKRIYSLVNQAVEANKAEYGDFPNWVKDCGTGDVAPRLTCTLDETVEWYNAYLGKYIKSTKIEKSEENSGFYIYLVDGSVLFIKTRIYDMRYYINAKAVENPLFGKNVFQFRFNPYLLAHQVGATNDTSAIGKGFEPYAANWDGTREGLFEGKNSGESACQKPFDGVSGYYCTKLIQLDGWEIKDDYPW